MWGSRVGQAVVIRGRLGVLVGGVAVADVEFMFSDSIGGSGGMPLVDEGKLDLEEGIGVRVWCYGLMAKVNVQFAVDKWCSYQNYPWGKLGEMSLPRWSWVDTLVMLGK